LHKILSSAVSGSLRFPPYWLLFLQKYVADFYVSDFHTGLRALIKTGYGEQVAPLVDAATVDITRGNRDLSPNFLHWLADRNLASDDRILRLKEG